MSEKKQGRPTDYRPEYIEQVYRYSLLGATDIQMAEFLGCAESTFHKWKLDYPEFSESIKKGKTEADAKVAEMLYSRATGYKYSEKKTTKRKTGEVTTMEVTETEKTVPPDTTAQIFWLKNRQPKEWLDKHKIVTDDGSGGDAPINGDRIDYSKLSEAATRELLSAIDDT